MFDFGTFDFFVGLALLWLFFKGLELISKANFYLELRRKGLTEDEFWREFRRIRPLHKPEPTNQHDQTKNKN